jgi:hypothetical protein
MSNVLTACGIGAFALLPYFGIAVGLGMPWRYALACLIAAVGLTAAILLAVTSGVTP